MDEKCEKGDGDVSVSSNGKRRKVFIGIILASLAVTLVLLKGYSPKGLNNILQASTVTTYQHSLPWNGSKEMYLLSSNKYIHDASLRNVTLDVMTSELMKSSSHPFMCNLRNEYLSKLETSRETVRYSNSTQDILTNLGFTSKVQSSNSINVDAQFFCDICEYPENFILETSNILMQNRSLILNACTENLLTLRAVDKYGRNVNCPPWADIHGRIIGPNLDKYPANLGYSLYFNKVRVLYSGQGNFLLNIPALPVGKYRLEISLAHTEQHRSEMFNTRHKVPCLDKPVGNLPEYLILTDNENCTHQNKIRSTPLCTTGTSPGRWVTLPTNRCDGVHCEGDVGVLASSGRVWAPYDCHYKLYGSQDVEKCFRGKKVLLIGDSITEELTNELLQIYYYENSLMTKSEMTKKRIWIERPDRWSRPLESNGARIGFSFIMATPLGCGIDCVVRRSDEDLRRKLAPYGQIDLLIILTGPHDLTPRGKTAERLNVFEKYKNLLPAFLVKVQKLLSPSGKIVWLNSPEGSDRSRCDFLSKPRVNLLNAITEEFLEENTLVKRLDYFEVSESCYCGNIHKGIRFYQDKDAAKQYNGFVSRMAAHIILTLFCQ